MKAYKGIANDGRVVIGGGNSACEYPLDVFGCTPPAVSEYCEVQQSGVIETVDYMTESTEMKIGPNVSFAELIGAAVDYTFAHSTIVEANQYGRAAAEYKGAARTGADGAAIAGNRGAAVAGNNGVAAAGAAGAAVAGIFGTAVAGTGGGAMAGGNGVAVAGNYGAAVASNDGVAVVGADGVAEAGMSGVAVARGRASVGKKGICVARGENARVRGGVGAVLVIADEHGKCKVAIVDGEKIKADTWYKMSFGELQEDV